MKVPAFMEELIRQKQRVGQSEGGPASPKPTQEKKPERVTIPQGTYYREVSARYVSAQVILLMLLAVFIAVSFLTNTDLLSTDNLVYFVKDLRTSLSLRETSASDTLVYTADSSNQYTLYRDGLAVLGSEKLTVFSSRGKEIQSDFCSFRNPRLSSSGRYLLAYDIGGKNYGVYNSFTCVKSDVATGAIRAAAVGKTGYYSLVCDGTASVSEVTLYDANCRLVNRYSLPEYAVCVDISDEKSRLLIAAVSTTNGVMQTTFLIATPGKDVVDTEWVLNHSFPVDCRWLDETTVAVLTTDQWLIYNEDGTMLASALLNTGNIRCAKISDDALIVLSNAIRYDNSSEILVFDKVAQVMYNVTVPGEVADAVLSGDRLCVLTEDAVYVYSPGEDDADQVLTLRQQYKVLLADSGGSVYACGEAKAIRIDRPNP